MTLSARARLSDAEGVELVLPAEDRPLLVRRLRASSPPIRTRRTADGVRIAIADVAKVTEGSEVQLVWEPLARAAVENRARVSDVGPRILAAARDITDAGVPAARAALADWSSSVALDDHQLINVALMTLPGGWGACVFDEQGTGKTVTTLAAFDLLVERGEADTLLLVAPKSMVAEWRNEFHRFLGDLYDVALVDGPRTARAETLHSGADVFVMGYETAAAHEAELRLLAERRRVVLVVDESFNVKNPAARRSDALRCVREFCGRCFVLCGTPAPNRPRDVVAQFDLVDFGYTFDGFDPDDDRDAERDAVEARLRTRGLYTRNLKDRVLPDLPARGFRELLLDLQPLQRRAYDAAAEDLLLDLRSADDERYGREILSFLERRLALLRMCSNPSSLTPGYDETPAKLLALDRLLAEQVKAGQKTVVWSFFRTSLEAIVARYRHLGLVAIDGSTPADERRDAVRRFQEDDDTRVFVGNPAAAGAGITLHRASTAIYESIGNQAAHWMQSLDRIHRRGQVHEVSYVLLVCRDTLEESEYARLRDKAGAQAALLADPTPAIPTRRELMAELERADGSA